MITQDAFHYYADNREASGRISQNNTYMKVFDILVGKAEDNAIKSVPENAVINILQYDPNGKSNFQNLLTVDFRPGPVDEPTTADVTFSKVAAGQGEELPGATLTVTGGDNFSEEWVSTGTAKQLTLAPGEYTMTEEAAPEGYLIANSINFRITENGTLEIKGTDGQYTPAENATVQMIDELAPVDTPAEPRDTTPGSEARGPQTPATREQVTSLPRTGSMTGMLAMLSFALVAVGSLLTLRRKDV